MPTDSKHITELPTKTRVDSSDLFPVGTQGTAVLNAVQWTNIITTATLTVNGTTATLGSLIGTLQSRCSALETKVEELENRLNEAGL